MEKIDCENDLDANQPLRGAVRQMRLEMNIVNKARLDIWKIVTQLTSPVAVIHRQFLLYSPVVFTNSFSVTLKDLSPS